MLYSIVQWCKAFTIHEKIRKKLEDLKVTYVLTLNKPRSRGTYTIHYGFKKKSLSPKDYDYIIYLIDEITKDNFVWFIRRLKKNGTARTVAVLNGEKKEFFRFFPQGLTIVHKYRSSDLTPKPRTYDKNIMLQKLELLIDKVSDLPIKPLGIFGFGSFFRHKAKIGDVDLLVEANLDDLRWKQFVSFFLPDKNPKYRDFIDFISKAIWEEDKKAYENKRRKIISFATKCKNLEFQGRIRKLNVDFELLQHCTWSQFHRMFTYRIGPDFFEMFKRMWIGKTKGFQVMSKSTVINRGHNILLWSPESPNFQKNYRKFLTKDCVAYILKSRGLM